MAHEEKLAAVLAEFARTMVTDFPIQGILDRLVGRIVEILPVSAAGVTLISADTAPRYVAASSPEALRFERLQSHIEQGPCILAYTTGERVLSSDLSSEDRFPQFSAAALSAGLHAVFTFPLRHGEGCMGALDLYRDVPGELDPDDMGVAQTLADVVASYLINATARGTATDAAERLRHTAQHDPLTGLPNRVLLKQRIEHAARRAKRSRSHAAVLFADLDRFKQVNDTYGHQTGDELLVAVANRLAALVRPGDTLARVSGDEFVFLCEDMSDATDAERLAQRIGRAFAEPFQLSMAEISVTASVGMAFAGPGENVSDMLIGQADIAMYQAKRRGGATHQVVDLHEVQRISDRGRLQTELHTAFAHEKLHVAYQPIVRSSDGLMTGVEALLRWTDPDRGPIPANTIIALAEESGLIERIGEWVLRQACMHRTQWLEEHAAVLDMSVNVSGRQLTNPEFVTDLSAILTETGMDPTALILELTESILIEDSEDAIIILADLKRLGLRLALDDFGTGYSSLSYLRRMSIDIVKIDQGFIADIGRDPTGRAIVAAISNLAQVLGLSVTAEGVESQIQRDEVASTGCESSQGFYYGRPMPAADIEALLRVGPPHLGPALATAQ